MQIKLEYLLLLDFNIEYMVDYPINLLISAGCPLLTHHTSYFLFLLYFVCVIRGKRGLRQHWWNVHKRH